VKAEVVNDELISFLKQYSLNPNFKELFGHIVIDSYKQIYNTEGLKTDIILEIDKLEDKLIFHTD